MSKKKNINYSYIAGIALFIGITAMIENRSYFQNIFSKKEIVESKKYQIDTMISSSIKVDNSETKETVSSNNDFYEKPIEKDLKTNETKLIAYLEVDNSFNLYVYDLKGNRISSSPYIAGRDRRIKYSECIIVMVDRGNTYVYDEKLKEISNCQGCISYEDSFQVTGCNIVVKKGGPSTGYTYIFDKKCDRIN
jgi:hypothetical protein